MFNHRRRWRCIGYCVVAAVVVGNFNFVHGAAAAKTTIPTVRDTKPLAHRECLQFLFLSAVLAVFIVKHLFFEHDGNSSIVYGFDEKYPPKLRVGG
ncbi:MAG: hypothetical protein H6661_05270 [Ardenticatenaceae bacterium]|nr:hypothetical protein [Ardenticatenaceae bacterium]